MSPKPKTEQLQLRVSPSEKLAIKHQAARAGMTMSEWILGKLVPSLPQAFQAWMAALAEAPQPSLAFAELLEALSAMTAREFELATAEAPAVLLSPYWQNYVAATLEHAAILKGARAPAWTVDVAPLEEPAFGSALKSLRLHLLVNSPPAFVQRNIFVDSTVGDRV